MSRFCYRIIGSHTNFQRTWSYAKSRSNQFIWTNVWTRRTNAPEPLEIGNQITTKKGCYLTQSSYLPYFFFCSPSQKYARERERERWRGKWKSKNRVKKKKREKKMKRSINFMKLCHSWANIHIVMSFYRLVCYTHSLLPIQMYSSCWQVYGTKVRTVSELSTFHFFRHRRCKIFFFSVFIS